MQKSEYEIIFSQELYLRNGEISPEIAIKDENNENLYLTFQLNYIKNEVQGLTHWKIIDEHHASFLIDTRPNSVTEPSKLIDIGTMEDGRSIFIGFTVQAQIPQTGKHQITVNIYTTQVKTHTEKEVSYGI